MEKTQADCWSYLPKHVPVYHIDDLIKHDYTTSKKINYFYFNFYQDALETHKEAMMYEALGMRMHPINPEDSVLKDCADVLFHLAFVVRSPELVPSIDGYRQILLGEDGDMGMMGYIRSYAEDLTPTPQHDEL
jgi:hypothetical protein